MVFHLYSIHYYDLFLPIPTYILQQKMHTILNLTNYFKVYNNTVDHMNQLPGFSLNLNKITYKLDGPDGSPSYLLAQRLPHQSYRVLRLLYRVSVAAKLGIFWKDLVSYCLTFCIISRNHLAGFCLEVYRVRFRHHV